MLVLVGMVAVVQVGADGRESRAEAAPAALAQDPTSCPTPISLKNGNFESPTVPNGAGTNVLEGTAGLEWLTTASDNLIEFWRGTVTAANGGLAISAQSGSQWVELNATQTSSLYQQIATTPGQTMRWSIWHRARSRNSIAGDDTNTMQVKIGSTVTNAVAQVPAGQTSANISTTDAQWVQYTGTYTVPAGQTSTAFVFSAVSGTSGNATLGNFLDNIIFGNAPCIITDKSVRDVNGGVTTAGDVLEYTVRATNNGGAASILTSITDQIPANTTYVPGSLTVDGTTRTDAIGDDVGQVSGGVVRANVGSGATASQGGSLAVGQTATVTFRVRVNDGVAAGTPITNTAETRFRWLSATDTERISTSQTTTNTVERVGLTLDKTRGTVTDVNNNGLRDAGDRVTYSFLVTNTGSTQVTGVSVSDPKVGAVSCPTTTLAAGASTTCTATYTITQADTDNGQVLNTATATANPPNNNAPVTATDSDTLTLDRRGGITLDKQSTLNDGDGDNRADVGEQIQYRFVVRNTGNVSLTSVAINDPRVQATCPTGPLAPGDERVCTATYTVTQADVNSGSVDNTATASGTTPTGNRLTSDPDSTTVPTERRSGLALDKTAALSDRDGDGAADVGETITFRFAVRNTGTVTVDNVTINDPKLRDAGVTVSCPTGPLAPGETRTCTATYTVTQDDIDAGSVSNTATASGTAPSGVPNPTSAPDDTVTPVDSTSGISLDKSAVLRDGNANNAADVGEVIDYTFAVTNDGGVTLTDVRIDDPKVGPVTCPTRIAPGATVTCQASYTVTQADVDAGTIVNTATAVARTPSGESLRSAPDTTRTPTDRTAALTLDKRGTLADGDGDGLADVGETVNYSFIVENTGTTTLTGLSVTDPKVTGVSCPTTTLAPGATTTCTATYTVTQGDLDAGGVANTARATATPPTGVDPPAATDSHLIPADVETALALVKDGTPADENGDGRVQAGETIDYTFTVTNEGTQTVSGLRVQDPKMSVTCPTTTLAPNASVTCTGSYTVTQTDVDNGAVVNNAVATGTTPGGASAVSNESTHREPTSTRAALAMTKTSQLADLNGNGGADVGETISYEFRVRNVGDVTLRVLRVDDPMLAAAGIEATCTGEPIEPGQTTTCSATYTVTQADVDRGTITNTATAVANDPEGNPVRSNESSTSIDAEQTPAFTLDKQADLNDGDSDALADAGETIDYSFVVTNTGTTTLTNVTVTDPKLGAVDCPTGTLAPGASITCTATYTVTQGDVDSGSVDNRRPRRRARAAPPCRSRWTPPARPPTPRPRRPWTSGRHSTTPTTTASPTSARPSTTPSSSPTPGT
ncbi:DUF11 domain-containing protein [Nocardioides rotundus]|uniref:DUF7507 domain-containing protein n=1 Tax=Nocardioides rotundus TaxID=1774216 RepID=UPI001CC0C2F2|nr:isopeptide-forming domain-containing fimbrial protein [Nocardioides rotundus]UAL28750.1 DUF11 domain-containing protein [Nocardioides rotundus]